MFVNLKTKVDELKDNNKEFSMQFYAFENDEIVRSSLHL